MKVLALGGCGQEWQPAAERFANSKQVSEVIIGDINIDKAQALAAELGVVIKERKQTKRLVSNFN